MKPISRRRSRIDAAPETPAIASVSTPQERLHLSARLILPIGTGLVAAFRKLATRWQSPDTMLPAPAVRRKVSVPLGTWDGGLKVAAGPMWVIIAWEIVDAARAVADIQGLV